MASTASDMRISLVDDPLLTPAVQQLLTAIQRADATALREVTAANDPAAFLDFASSSPAPLRTMPYELANEDAAVLSLRAASLLYHHETPSDEIAAHAYEAIGRLLEENRTEWALYAADIWRQAALFQVDARNGARMAVRLLERYPRLREASAELLAQLAVIASLGDHQPDAERLWNDALTHPTAETSADVGMRVHMEYAAAHLLVRTGDVPQAVTLLQRARNQFAGRAGHEDFHSFHFASMNLGFALMLGNRSGDARVELTRDVAHCAPESEYGAYLYSTLALACALDGDDAATAKALAESDAAHSVANSFLLVTNGPARLLMAGRAGDLEALHELVAQIRLRESATPCVAMHQAFWRIQAATAYCMTSSFAKSRLLLDEVRELLAAAEPLPAYELHLRCAQLAVARAAGDAPDVLAEAALGIVDLADRHPLLEAAARSGVGALAGWLVATQPELADRRWAAARRLLESVPRTEFQEQLSAVRQLRATVAGDAAAAALVRMLDELGEALPETHLPPLSIRLMGGFSIRVGGEAVPLGMWKGRRKARVLLAHLAITPGVVHSRDAIAEKLWPTSNLANVSDRMSPLLYTIRRVLGLPVGDSADDSILSSAARAYCLRLRPQDDVDVLHFLTAARSCLAADGNSQQVEREGLRALELYGGEFMAGEGHDEWLVATRRQLVELYSAVVLELVAHGITPPRLDRCISELEGALKVDATQENACFALMKLYALDGKASQAAKVFDRTRTELMELLELEPSAPMLELHDALVRRTLQGALRTADSSTSTT